jgi:hypothetical protein
LAIDVAVTIVGERQHFGFELIHAAAVQDAIAFIQERRGLTFCRGWHDFSNLDHAASVGTRFAALMHAFGGLSDHVGRHRPAIVHLNADVVGVKVVVRLDHDIAPLGLTRCDRSVGKHREPAVVEQRRDDGADFVFAAGGSTTTVTCSMRSLPDVVVNEPGAVTLRFRWSSWASENLARAGTPVLGPRAAQVYCRDRR